MILKDLKVDKNHRTIELVVDKEATENSKSFGKIRSSRNKKEFKSLFK